LYFIHNIKKLFIATLFAAYSHPTLFDHYYSNSISLLVSPSSSIYPIPISNKINNNNNELSQSAVFPSPVINTASLEQNQDSLAQNSNKMNVPFLLQLQQQQQKQYQQRPMSEIDSFSIDKTANLNVQTTGLMLPSEFLKFFFKVINLSQRFNLTYWSLINLILFKISNTI